jgi:hypothetical protein
MKRLLPVFATAVFGFTAAAHAAPVDFGMSIQGRAGYGSNPFLAEEDNPGALLVGIRLAPEIRTRTETSTSTLSGFYDYTHYTRRYSHSDTLGIDATHQQAFSPTLSGNIHAAYIDSLNALYGPIDSIDEVAIGRRQRIVSGDAGFTYQPNARETWSLNGRGSHASYPGSDSEFSGYDTYGGDIGYSRALSSATSVGARFAVTRYDSRHFADTTSYQPSLTLTQRLSSTWTLNGHVGVILQRVSFGGATSRSTSIGFGANLCRQAPRSTLCFEASRDTAPSGLGGLRTETRGSATFDYKLTERSTLSGSVIYGHSKAGNFLMLGDQDYGVARGEYSHRLTERLSIGASLDYRLQKYAGAGTRHAVAGALNITAQIGRLR